MRKYLVFIAALALSVGVGAGDVLTCYMGAEHDRNAVDLHEHECSHTNVTRNVPIFDPKENSTQVFNVTHSIHHTGGPVSHCVISKYEQSGSVKIDYHCDYDFACRDMASTNADNGVMVFDKGTWYLQYCCSDNLCNTQEKAEPLQIQKLTCYNGSSDSSVDTRSCHSPYCFKQTSSDEEKTLFDCDMTNVCMENAIGANQCKTVTDPITGTTSELCCCAHDQCNGASFSIHPSTPLAPIPNLPNPGVRERPDTSTMNAQFATTMIAIVLLGILVLVALAISLRRFKMYQQRRHEQEEFSYRQLTIDFENQQDDDRMIVP